jgi:hypothetical protein
LKMSVWGPAATAQLAMLLTDRRKDPRRLRLPC